jgi:hypothetical protein
VTATRRSLVYAAIAIGIVLIVVAVIYWIDTAAALPSFFPGHQAGSSTHHVKHGIAALVVGLGCLVLAWFATGPNARRRA